MPSTVELAQHIARPGLPAGIIGSRICARALRLQRAQIGAIARQATLAAQHQRGKPGVAQVRQAPAVNIGKQPPLQQVARSSRVAAINRAGQLTDAAVRTKAVGMAQHGGLLLEQMGRLVTGLQAAACQRLTADLLQPIDRGR